MTTLSNRVVSMSQTVESLKAMQRQLTAKLAANGIAPTALTALTAGVGQLVWPVVQQVTGRAGINDSAQDSLRLTGQAIDLLSGAVTSERYGNMYLRAQSDDAVFQFWGEYAQNTGETLAMALGLTQWSITQFFRDGLGNVAAELKELAPHLESTGNYIVVILALVLLIIIFK